MDSTISTHPSSSPASSSAPPPKPNVMLFGNPGVGKSTLLNTLIGSTTFASGLSLGAGLTRSAHTCETDRYIFVDTPGLEDITLRSQAAQALSNMLSLGGTFKLILVITLEAGVIRAADVRTMTTIVTALKRARVPSVVVDVWLNKISNAERAKLQHPDMLAAVANAFSPQATGLSSKPHIHIIPYLDAAAGVDNADLGLQSPLLAFVDQAKQTDIPLDTHVVVDEEVYTRLAMEMETGGPITNASQLIGHSSNVSGTNGHGAKSKLPGLLSVLLGVAAVVMAAGVAPKWLCRMGSVLSKQLRCVRRCFFRCDDVGGMQAVEV